VVANSIVHPIDEGGRQSYHGRVILVGGGDMRVLSPVAALGLAAIVLAHHLGYDRPFGDPAGRSAGGGRSPRKHQICGGLYERQRDGTYKCDMCGDILDTLPKNS
jgi:hypothetical protein